MNEVKSDYLESARKIAHLLKPLDEIVGVPVQFRIIVDACIVNSDLRWLLGSRRNPEARTNLQEVIDAGTVIAYAPKYLETELAEHYSEIARECEVSVDSVHNEWLKYKERLILYSPKKKLPSDVTISDIDDVEYGVAYFELAANAVLTEDKGFNDSGIPTINKQVIIELRRYSRDSAWHYSMYYGTATIGVIAGTILEEFIKFLPNI